MPTKYSKPLLLPPVPGDEIVISGIAGYFPKSNSVMELQENLFNKVDMLSDINESYAYDINPKRMGKINKHTKFDQAFFGIDYIEAHCMNPMGRMLLERTYEAIIDAGINPVELQNTKTGVFIACTSSESEEMLLYDKVQENMNGIMGCSEAMLALQISNWLNVNGPAYKLDSACSSSMHVLEQAFKYLREEHIDYAIVGGVQLNTLNYTGDFDELCVLSKDGSCKSFDDSADGFIRSEAIVACFLQKAKTSRRIYAQIVYSKTACDGFKEEGIIHPSMKEQKRLLTEFYEECSIPTRNIEYMEFHATGTRKGDFQELGAVDAVMCTGRSKPLLIGSVRSNMGHAETVAALCSIVKLCIAYNTGYIPPNINFRKCRQDVPALVEGRLQVVTDKLPWNRGLVALNSFGFGGSNAHTLLKNIAKHKEYDGAPQDDLPRLICVSGRTHSAVSRILDSFETKKLDVEEVGLWHAIHEHNIEKHGFRGYALLQPSPNFTSTLKKEIHRVSGIRPNVCFFYSGIKLQCTSKATQLMKIPAFTASLKKCHEILIPKGIDLINIIHNNEPDLVLSNSSIIITAVQIALTSLLKAAQIEPDFVTGYGTGKIACDYADGCLTMEQAMLIAYDNIDKVMASKEESDFEKYLAFQDVEYKKMTSPFTESRHIIPTNCIIIDVSPQLKFRDPIYTGLSAESHDNGLEDFFNFLGKLYLAGLNPRIANLYPLVSFPVSQGTPMLSHLVEWDHREEWFTDPFVVNKQTRTSIERVVVVSVEKEKYLRGNIVDGCALYPASGYLVLVWETLANMMQISFQNMSVGFENVCFEKSVEVPMKGHLEFIVTIHRITGEFEVTENDVTIATGRVYLRNEKSQDLNIVTEDNTYDKKTTGIRQYLQSADIYKLLYLRGYKPSDNFQRIVESNIEGTYFHIHWVNNWVIFLDSLLQTFNIKVDACSIMLPTHIDKISINVSAHYASLRGLNDPKIVKAHGDQYFNDIRSAGIEIIGVDFTFTIKTPVMCSPVVETYGFFPFEENNPIQLENAIRANIHLILENVQTYTFSAIEVIDIEYKKNHYEPLLKSVVNILHDEPLINAELSIITDYKLEIPPSIMVDNNVANYKNATLVIGANLCENSITLNKYWDIVGDKGFIMSRESRDFEKTKYLNNYYNIVSYTNTGNTYLVVLRKKNANNITKFVEIKTDEYSWIDKLKQQLNEDEVFIVYSQNECSGLIGFLNCLRKEPDGENVRGFLIKDTSAPAFNSNAEFYKKQIDKNFTINVYENNQWGTYCHLPLNDLDQPVPLDNPYLIFESVKDLSTLKWTEGYLNVNCNINPEILLTHVYCAPLNFHDVMAATSRVILDDISMEQSNQEYAQGVEFVGRTANGSRIMGMAEKALSNMVLANSKLVMAIPEEWSFEEAATVFVAYCTAYAALIVYGNLKHGESVLIHACLEDIGQAAVNIALSYDCDVFVTISSDEERVVIRKLFPRVKDSHVAFSGDSLFEEMIQRETNGKGIDVVINSLIEQQLPTTIRCLRERGRFLNISKFDIQINTSSQMYFYQKEISFHGVTLEHIQQDKYAGMRQKILSLMASGIMSGAVRPLTHCTFGKDDVKSAYKYMSDKKNTGKIVIKFRDEEPTGTKPILFPIKMEGERRYCCNSNNVYILIGGLGGFGLELADWLIIRGAKKLVLVSRRGVTTGYQALKIRKWKSFGVYVEISTHDVTKESGCKDMLEMANFIGPVAAVFNVAMVPRNLIFEHQTHDTFDAACAPKAYVALHLDKLTRTLCPNLKDFVMFSSYISGRGNAGQTNYGFANSVMERVCEKRKKDGLPALAIQWGTIDDVGYMMVESSAQEQIKHVLQKQNLDSCLNLLNKFLKLNFVVVSSYIPSEKRLEKKAEINMEMQLDAVAKTMGMKDLKSISYQMSFSEMGMDSIVAVELKNLLERTYEIFLSAKEMRALTFARLEEMFRSKKRSLSTDIQKSNVTISLILRLFMKSLINESIASKAFISIPSSEEDNDFKHYHSEKITFMVAGPEGCTEVFVSLCRQLKTKGCVLQLGLSHLDEDVISMVDRLYESLKLHHDPNATFNLVGYSFGVILVLELAAKLEREGLKGTVYCIDGSPLWCKYLIATEVPENNNAKLQNDLIGYIIDLALPDNRLMILANIKEIKSFDDKIDYALQNLTFNNYSHEYLKQAILMFYNRVNALRASGVNFKKLESLVILIRCKNDLFATLPEDYGLQECAVGQIFVHLIENDHISIVEDEQCLNILKKYLTANNDVSE